MQLYYMKKEKIPVPVSAVVLMIVTITYKLVLVAVGIGILFFGGGFRSHYLKGILPVYYMGLVLNVVCVGFMTGLVFHPRMAEYILIKGEQLLLKLHIMKGLEKRKKKLRDAIQVYRETAQYLKMNKIRE